MKRLFWAFLALLLLGCTIPTRAGNISGTITVQGGGAWPSGLWLALGKIDGSEIVGATDVSGGTYSFSVPYDISVNFYLSTNGEWPTYYPSSDWVFVEGGTNPFTYDYTGGDVTLNLEIKPAGGGGGDDTPKASLVGRVLEGTATYTDCMMGVTVALSKDDYSAETTTEYYEPLYDILGCPYGYEFKNLELGTYTLTYTKYNYITQTQTVTIDETGQKLAPSVTLQPKPSEYVFEGNIKYLNADNEEVYVEGATITAYDGGGEDANVVGEPVHTDANGHWTMTVECEANATLYFYAEHPNIVVTGRKSAQAYSTSGVYVDIPCTENTPDLLGFATHKVKQVEVTVNGATQPGVEISWTWPKDLTDNYKTTDNAKGAYRITAITVFRYFGTEYREVGKIQPEEGEMPATSFVDGENPNYPLSYETTYKYKLSITYSHPTLGNVEINNDDHLTITLGAGPVVTETVTLTLTPSPADWGTVDGAGTYDKNDQVMIYAKANKGYVFKEWQKDGQTYVTEAEYKVTLTENMALTAVFEERPPILDSVDITLAANNDMMGTVEGTGRYPKGEEVTITATPKAGYAFKQWKAGTVILSSQTSYTFVANTDSTITAVFERAIVYRAMINCRARQTSATSIRLDWEWPQELIDDYKTDKNPDGIYEISTITIGRNVPGGSNPTTFTICPEAHTLPSTFYVDNSTEASPLEVGATYFYYFEVIYGAPAAKTVPVNSAGNDPKLEVTVAGSVDPVQHYTLTLGVNDDEMGEATVTGGIYEYEEGDQVTVKATPKSDDYIFECWKEGGEEVYKNATYTFKMPGRNLVLTAVFVKKSQTVMATLTLTVNDEAMGTVSGDGEFVAGTQVTARAFPKEGYVFKAWNENGEQVHDKSVYTFNLEADRTLEAVFGVQSGETETVTINVEANDAAMGTVTGSGEYTKGEPVTVTATANTGYIFKGWQEDGQMLNAPATYTFKANANRTLTAVFTDKVNVTLQVNNAAMGTVTGAGQYKIGTEVTVKATPNKGYVFQAWKNGEEEVSTEAEYKLVVSGDITLTAMFAPAEKVRLTIEVNDAAMGTVSGEGEYEKGTEVTVKATPNEGYAFRAWKLGDEVVSTEAEYTFVLNESQTLTAVFATHIVAGIAKLTLEVNDETMGTVTGEGQYKKGTEVTVKAFANEGYVFQAWKEGEETVSTEAEYTFTLTDDLTLMAVFVEKEANEDVELAAWDVFAESGRIVLHSNTDCRYEVYTAAGILVKQGKMYTNACSIAVDNSGLYIVRRISSTGISVKKVVVR